MRVSLWIATSAVLLMSTPVFAQGDDATKGDPNATSAVTVNAIFGRFGFSSTPEITPTSCKVEMELNQKTMLDHIDDLKALNLLNPDITQTAINLEPTVIVGAFAIEMLPVATKEVYDNNSKADHCEFSESVVASDDYGNDKRTLIFSYSFTRALYQRINWDNFDAKNMMKVAPRFHLNPSFAAQMAVEGGGGAN